MSPETTQASDHPPPRGQRRRWLWGLGLLLAIDLLLVPARFQVSNAVLLGGIDLYQATASQWMPHLGVSCRFTPTCSHYAEAVLRRDGALLGSLRTVGRILRCGPWTPAGTYDPPDPELAPDPEAARL